MKVIVVGGKLQGIEASYLARKAGWQIILIDKNPQVPARGLSDEFVLCDVTKEKKKALMAMKKGDLIIPALEDKATLQSLEKMAEEECLPLAFDSKAYELTSSKKKSDSLFEELNLPRPEAWPNSSFPLILKPSGLSGSRGIRKVSNPEELESFLAQNEIQDWVVQEYLEGPSYSLEVLGHQGRFFCLQPTEIHVDRNYDCKRIFAPAELSPRLKAEFEETSLKIAEALSLEGIMDVEVILNQGKLKVLEIDARLPSQTPSAVFKSTGINMLELLYHIFAKHQLPEIRYPERETFVIYEHIEITLDKIEILGEHRIGSAGSLRLVKDFFEAEEALTDYAEGKKNWVATLIISGGTREIVWKKHEEILTKIRKNFGLDICIDLNP